METSLKPQVYLRPATKADIPQLADIVFEAFHPASAFMRQAQPDKPGVRAYWNHAGADSLSHPDVRLMLVADKSKDPERIIAVGRFGAPPSDSSHNSEELDAGTWSRIPLSSDHDHELCNAFIDFLALGRRKAMTGRKHYSVELLGTSHEYQGRGAGRLLMEYVCAEADRDDAAVFVETNTNIVKFYEKFGFDVFDKLVMPGGFGYEEFIMVRPAKGERK